MTKTFKTLAFIAAAAMTLAGCSKEIEAPTEKNDASTGKTHTVTFLAQQVATKTNLTVNPSTKKAEFAWDEGAGEDKEHFHIFENGCEGLAEAEFNGGKATIITAFGDHGAPYKYTGYMAYNVSDSKPAIPAAQNSNGKYDPAADILIAKEVTSSTAIDEIDFQFGRVVAINKVVFSGINAGENITQVTITSDKEFVGPYDFANYSWAADGKTITLTCNNAADDFAVWFVCAPVENAQLNIDVTTNANTYSLDHVATVTFLQGGVKFFGASVKKVLSFNFVTKPAGWPTEKGSSAAGNYTFTLNDVAYTFSHSKVGDGIYCGGTSGSNAYLLVAKNNSLGLPAIPGFKLTKVIGQLNNQGSPSIKSEVSITDGSSTLTGGSSQTWDAKGGKYTYSLSGTEECTSYYVAISNTNCQIINLDLVYEATPARASQVLSFPKASYDINISDAFIAPTVSGAHTSVTYSSSNTAVATVDENSGAVTIKAVGTTTITAVAASNESYRKGTASYVINVSDPLADVLTTMDAIYSASATEGNYKVRFDNWVVSGVKNSNAYVTDGTKGFIIYTSSHGFEVGDILSGIVNSLALKQYKGAAEFTNLSATTSGLTVTKGGTVTPQVVNISDLSGVNSGALITINNVTFNGENFVDGSSNAIKPYNALFSYTTPYTGVKYNVTGVYLQYNTTKEILPRQNEDIQEVVATKYAINIAPDIEHGTVVSSLSEAAEGTEITLTTIPASGYKLSTLTVTDSESNIVSVTNNKFTMPASEVTVTATFVVNTGGETWIDATMDKGTNGSEATVNDKTAIKVGTSKLGGNMTITVPAGAKKLRFYAAAWKGVSGLSIAITPSKNVSTASISLTADDGIANNSPFTLKGNEDSYKFEVTLSDITAKTTFIFEASTSKRFVLWGAQYAN